jgi:hypothetical protein
MYFGTQTRGVRGSVRKAMKKKEKVKYWFDLLS